MQVYLDRTSSIAQPCLVNLCYPVWYDMKLTVFLGEKTSTTPSDIVDIPWSMLEDLLRELTTPGPKGSAGYLVAGEVTGTRCEANTGPATALVVDYEPPGAADWDHWPCAFLAHSTDSHGVIGESNPAGGERWRVFLDVGETPISAEAYKNLKRAVEAQLPAGSKIRGRSQPAFLPTKAETLYRSGGSGALAPAEVLLVAGEVSRAGVPAARVTADGPPAAILEALVTQWVSVWPETGRHDCSFALGGLLARGCWPDEACLMFAEQILMRTDSDVEDGLRCVELSLEAAGDGVDTYGIPTLVGLLKDPRPPSLDGTVPQITKSVILTKFLKDFVEQIQPPPPPPPAPKQLSKADEDFLTWQSNVKIGPKTGRRLANSFNVALTFVKHPHWQDIFAWDEFASKVWVRRDGPKDSGIRANTYWTADNGGAFAVQEWFSRNHFDEIQKTLLIDGIHFEACKHTFHPIREYLNALPVWDGVDRNLATYFGAIVDGEDERNKYHRAVCAAWLRSAVARVMRPGCQADSLLVLEGRQGARKSTAIRVLCPDPNHHLVVRADVRAKDFLSNMRGRWIAEFAEVDKLIGSRDASELKDILSTTIDVYRKSHGRDDLGYPRQLVFAGTTNQTDYLRDETGNRRYWVVRCGALIDTDALERDRDQLWAQAYAEYLNGELWWLPEEIEKLAEAEAAVRLEIDLWESEIEKSLPELIAADPEGFTTLDALGKLPGALPVAQITKRERDRMSKILKKLGCKYKEIWADGGRKYRWVKE
jgi:hypothetical protein